MQVGFEMSQNLDGKEGERCNDGKEGGPILKFESKRFEMLHNCDGREGELLHNRGGKEGEQTLKSKNGN